MQYGDISMVYDALMYDIPYKAWAEYIFKKINGAKTVLELGSGTGSMTMELASRYDVQALDISSDMLEVAREKLIKNGKSARLISGDMCDFSLQKPVDAVVSVCDGINYLITPEKVKQAFLSVYKNLKPNGRFIFDISTEYKLKGMDGQLYSEDADDVTYIWRNKYENKIITMDIAFFVHEEDENYFRFDETHLQRAHSKDEIEAWLNECGFDLISVTDDYTENSVTEQTMRMTFCAARKEG